MWERWIRLKEARLALRAGKLEEAYRLTLEPSIRDHRRAVDVRHRASRDLLARARRSRAKGDLVHAYEDVKFLLQAGERSEDALALDRELRVEIDERRETERHRRYALEAARRKADAGDLDSARESLAPMAGEWTEAANLLREIERRARDAEHAASAAQAALRRGRVAEAEARLEDLRSLAPRHAAAEALSTEIRERKADEALARAKARLGEGRLHEARKSLGEARSLGRAEEAKALAETLAAAAEKAIDAAVDDGRFNDARDLLPVWSESPRAAVRARAVSAGLESLARALALRETGSLREAEEVLAAARRSLPKSGKLAALEKEIASTASEVERALDAATDALRRGDAAGAEEKLDLVLRRVPGHRAALAQRELLATAARAEREKLDRAEAALAEGRLEEARFLGLALAAAAPASERNPRVDAILRDADGRREVSRQALVAAEKVLATPSLEEVDLRRAEERLEGVMKGHRDYPALAEGIERLRRERLVREALRRGADAERRGELAEAIRLFRAEAVAGDPRVRLEAERLLGPALRERISAAERDLAARRPESARRAVEEALEEAVPGSPESERLLSLLETANSESAAASRLRDSVREALRSGDYGAATAALERLERTAPEAAARENLRAKVEACRAVENAIVRGADGPNLGKGGAVESDPSAERLKQSPADRSLLFHVKRRAGRQAGRVGSRFLLQVEEAGEWLVLSADRVTIGSVAGREADLRVMANVARLHAAIERGFDFHSGVTYRLRSLSEKECSVNGKPVTDAPLRSGDTIRLGPDLSIRFELPSEKSASARLSFAPGFGIEGVERVILFKSDGADGRIVLASSERAHVPVSSLRKEVEVFRGAESGDLVCHSLSGVEVDGEGGKAEERLYPGCYVRSGEVRFSVQSA